MDWFLIFQIAVALIGPTLLFFKEEIKEWFKRKRTS